MSRPIPKCKSCNDNHYGFQPCPAPVDMSGRLGPRFSDSGQFTGAKPGDQHYFNFPPSPRRSRLVGPDGQDYTP